MGTEGDSFFVVFRSAHDAVGAAVDGQRRLQAHTWPQRAQLRVRMGIHTGEPQRHEDGYIGEDVHRAARIGSTANGGQIVISAATRRLVSDLVDVEIRDLGHHRLKDLAGDELLYDVVARADCRVPAVAQPGQDSGPADQPYPARRPRRRTARRVQPVRRVGRPVGHPDGSGRIGQDPVGHRDRRKPRTALSGRRLFRRSAHGRSGRAHVGDDRRGARRRNRGRRAAARAGHRAPLRTPRPAGAGQPRTDQGRRRGRERGALRRPRRAGAGHLATAAASGGRTRVPGACAGAAGLSRARRGQAFGRGGDVRPARTDGPAHLRADR
jgi:hypothetical protein